MINIYDGAEYRYTCKKELMDVAKNVLSRAQGVISLDALDKRKLVMDEISNILDNLLNDRNSFIQEKQLEEQNKWVNSLSEKGESFLELLQTVPLLAENYKVKFILDISCENIINLLLTHWEMLNNMQNTK